MSKFLWYFLIVLHELRKRKLKPILAYITDSVYRQDIEQLRHDTGLGGVTTEGLVTFGRLVHGHKIHYWGWVETLIDRIHSGVRIDEETPITVVKFILNDQVFYRVIDGQHRFMAMRLSGKYRSRDLVHVKVYWKTK